MLGLYQESALKSFERVDLSPLFGKSVLITGANGLLGSHLLYSLIWLNKNKNAKISITTMSRSEESNILRTFRAHGDYQFVQKDLSQVGQWDGPKFDFVIHAATYGQPKKFLQNPLATMRLNAGLTEALLQNSVGKGGSFLFMSSSEIYGDPEEKDLPVKEEFPGLSSPVDQRSPYTSSKRYGETLCKVYDDLGDLKARIARVSSAYGAGVHLIDDRVINVFIRRALETQKLTMMDFGLQKRRWLYISDATAMLWHILLASKQMVYNVAGDDAKSIRELAELICKYTDAELVLPALQATQGHTAGAPLMIDMDNSKIKAEMNFHNLLGLSEGVQKTVEWTKILYQHQKSVK